MNYSWGYHTYTKGVAVLHEWTGHLPPAVAAAAVAVAAVAAAGATAEAPAGEPPPTWPPWWWAKG